LAGKKLKLLVDVGVGYRAETWLKGTDYDVKTIRDINPRLDDSEILRLAVSEKRLIITMDKDFGELVYKSKLPHTGVLLLRLEDERSQIKIEVLEMILTNFSTKILNKFSVFNGNKLRIRD